MKSSVNNEIRDGNIKTLADMRHFLLNWTDSKYFSQETLDRAIYGHFVDGERKGGFTTGRKCPLFNFFESTQNFI